MEPKLFILFWLLLLHHQRPSMSTPFPKAGCRDGTLKECKNAKFVPGHTLLGEGVDIVTMETTGSFLVDLQKIGEKCTVCMNPHNNNVLQKLPKAVEDWRPESSCLRNIQSSESRSAVSVAEEVTSEVQNDWKVGLSVNIFGVNGKTALGGSKSETTKFAESKSVTDYYSFLNHRVDCTFYSFRLKLDSNSPLKSDFQKSMKGLPDFYNDTSKAEYRRLIDKFGTHYITHVKLGGRTQEVTAVRTCEVSLRGLTMNEVKDCLAVEAEVGISKVSINSKVENCKRRLKEAKYEGDFHQAFSERVWKVIGGNATFDLLSPDRATPEVFDKWLESLKTFPGLVSYSLDSIHNLVKMQGPKKENIRLAISDYIQEKALAEKCPCPGSQVISKDDCSCTCAASGYTGSNCCPTNRGAARLVLDIKSANGLKGGDWGIEPDGFVVFRFGGAYKKTRIIHNTRNPTWNERYDEGPVELREGKRYTIEVWDKDMTYDDLLGSCEKVLTAGATSETCYLKNGWLTYSLNVICADNLEGQFCQNYIPMPLNV